MKTPQIYAQDSIAEVVSNGAPSEEFWVNIDGQYVTFAATSNSCFEGTEGYKATLHESRLDISHSGSLVTSILLGKSTQSLKQFPKITCGDYSNKHCLLGTENGGVHLLGESGSDYGLPGHLVYTSLAKFLPSGQVALTAGMDYSMKLWDLKEQSLAANSAEVQTLRYQRDLIDDALMIGRGRNVLSLCKNDSERTVALWEVGTPDVLDDYAVNDANCIELWDTGDSAIKNPDLHGGDGYLALIGSRTETLLVDFRQETPTKLMNGGADHLVVAGSHIYRSTESMLSCSDLRMSNTSLGEIETRALQLVPAGKGVAYRDSVGTYLWAAGDPLAVIGGENYGILVGSRASSHLYNLGSCLRSIELPF